MSYGWVSNTEKAIRLKEIISKGRKKLKSPCRWQELAEKRKRMTMMSAF
jgi:hypothetical protein